MTTRDCKIRCYYEITARIIGLLKQLGCEQTKDNIALVAEMLMDEIKNIAKEEPRIDRFR